MTRLEMEKAERTLNKKEKIYSDLMRKSFELSLKNRDRAEVIHNKAKALYQEIISTRRALNLDY